MDGCFSFIESQCAIKADIKLLFVFFWCLDTRRCSHPARVILTSQFRRVNPAQVFQRAGFVADSLPITPVKCSEGLLRRHAECYGWSELAGDSAQAAP